MRDVGDVYLQVPSARPPLDVNSVVEIARGLAVNGDNRQMPKIAPRIPLRIADRPRRAPRLRQHRLGKPVRQVVLADQDFDVDAEFARPPQHLEHAPRRRHAPAREPRQFDVHHGAIQLREPLRRLPAGCRAPSFACNSGVSSSPGGMIIACVIRVSYGSTTLPRCP